MPRVWVTGFEPFGEVAENPSALAVAALPATLDGVDLQRRILPVDTNAVDAHLEEIYASAPDVLLHVGVAETADEVRVERVAVNLRRFRIADNAGVVLTDRPVLEGAPDRLATRLFVPTILDALARAELPARPSDDAGTYLCNQVMFTSLARLPEAAATGFLHVPAHAAIAERFGRRGLPIDRIVEAVSVTLRATLAALVFLLVLTGVARAETPFMKGVTVSCPGYGQIWGTPEMNASLVALRERGVDWVAIHPYAGVRRDGSIRWQPAEETGYLGRAVAIAKAEKMPLFWKPHLAYWGSFEWRGTIAFESDEAWKRFFADYGAWIVDQAKFAQKHRLPLFSVGIEYAKTMRFEAEWRAIIAAIRKVYSGKITYSANWDDYDKVPFWDAVDLVGVQAYFPVGGDAPKRAEIEAAWDAHLATLGAFSKKTGKPMLFTEIGYARGDRAAAEPWKPDVDRSERARALRTLLLDVAMERIPRASFVRGMFWWKWLPGRARFDRDFSMRDAEALEALSRHWK